MSIDLRFTKEYNPKQEQALTILTNPEITRILAYGGGRSGKTTVKKDYTIKRAMFYPGSKHIVLRKTERDVRNTTWLETYRPTLKYLESKKACKIYKTPAMVEFINGSIIMTGGLATSEVDKVLAIEYATIHIDEASEVSYKSVIPLYTRLNDTSKHMATGKMVVPKIVFTENPPTTNHWTYKVFVLGMDPDDGSPIKNPHRYGKIQMNPVDNVANLSANYLEDLEALPERAKKRFYFGEFGQTSGLVYDNFDPERHVIDDDEVGEGKRYDLRKAVRLDRVVDFGFVHPFVCLWIALFSDDTLVVYREYYATGKTVRLNKLEINKLSKQNPITGDKLKPEEFIESYDKTLSDHDSEDRATLAETDKVENGQGIETEAADKEVLAGIDRQYDMYELNKIKICRGLTNLINEHYAYQWKEGSKKDREVVKLNDDGLDCMRYRINQLHEKVFKFFQVKTV